MESWNERVKRVLPEWEPPPFKAFRHTSPQDIGNLAQAYLDDAKIAGTLHDLGTHQFLTDAQQRFVDDFTSSITSVDWSDRDPFMADIALALARRVANGILGSTDSADAVGFIGDRYFTRNDNHSFLFENAREFSRYSPASELLDAARFFLAHQQLHRPKDPDEEVLYIYNTEDKFVKTHGLYIRSFISSAYQLMYALEIGDLKSLDGPDAQAYAVTKCAIGCREANIQRLARKHSE
ncbi:MAG: hypothetical protein ABL898_15810 [Hyphomicrobiaceae bacterium]